MRSFLWGIPVLLIAACSTNAGDDVVVPVVEVVADKSVVDMVPEVTMAEAVSEVRAPELIATELVSEEVVLPCQPGEGCFKDKCSENSECQSGFCVDHMGDGICTVACQEDCPPGWSCQPMGTGPDMLFACISNYTNLCRPCADANGCKAPGGAEDVCLDYGEEGNFCGGACEQDDDCPWGFSCTDAATVDGVELTQCVADAGTCPCTDRSVALGLWTPCKVTNDTGSCSGKRVCTEAGLSDCDATVPTLEECNGLDDDCDGDTDEPTLLEGKLLELCDDGNDCTEDACIGADGCQQAALEGVECIDGQSCTVADHCEAGICVGSPVECDDSNPCTDDTCNDIGGCEFAANTLPCDDGDPCTVADQCGDSECTGFAVDCDCQADTDCAALEDGNLCNGTLFCNMGKLPYSCQVAVETVVECPGPEGTDSPCLAAVCEPTTGACSLAAVGEAPCDDQNACTVNDKCVDGACTGGVAANCNDGNPCTEDACDPVGGCSNTPADGQCDDNNPCTEGDMCTGGVCKPTSLKDCSDGNPCTQDSCDLADECTHLPQDGPCDDGDPCTLNDQCAKGQCQPGPAAACDDGNPCTDDSCNDSGQCVHEPNSVGCDDGNDCTSGDHCSGGACTYDEVLVCDDSDVCTTDTCKPNGGCSYQLNQAPCNDENVCTTGDHCHLGQCISSGQLACNDGNDCTDDQCNKVSGCVFAPNDAGCDDGNKCTTGDACSQGQCTGGGVLDCDDKNACTFDSCVPGVGCQNVYTTAKCDDFDECTAGEMCLDGQCQGGLPVVCDDEDLCTDDSCVSDSGCQYVPNSAPCDDGNICTENDTCAESTCKPGTPLNCDDTVGCTVDACVPGTGCIHAPDAELCQDNNPCTAEICDMNQGCGYPPVANQTPCGQGDWVCIDGVCKESNPCQGGWAWKGRCWYQGPVMSSGNCPTCDTICAGHGGCHAASLVAEGYLEKTCSLCKATACPGCGCQDGIGNIAAHEAAPMHNGSTCEYTDHSAYPPICGVNHCNYSVFGRRRLCACNETP